MESTERAKILAMLEENSKLRRLYREHEALERRLNRFAHPSFLTHDEQMELQTLKKKKLRGVDAMLAILGEDKSSGPDLVA